MTEQQPNVTELPTRRRRHLTTLTVDIDIDEDLITSNGYHHEEDCTAVAEPDPSIQAGISELQRWHELAHGYSLWHACRHEPCNVLSEDFRSQF